MSLGLEGESVSGPGFPRVSGDEPGTDTITVVYCQFSPRERG